MQIRKFRFSLIGVIALFTLLVSCQSTAIRTLGPVFSSNAVFNFECDNKYVALTIDDGPDPTSTYELLELLKQHSATATFFVIGQNATSEQLKKISNAGHELGNHGYTEKALTQLTKQEIKTQLEQAEALLEVQQTVDWFRPAKGRINADVRSVVGEMGYTTVLADVFPYDHLIAFSKFHEAYIKTYVKPGSIIVLHEGEKRGKRTVNTLRQLLPWLSREGYKVRSLGEMVSEGGCRPDTN